jgi:hypothetical protein
MDGSEPRLAENSDLDGRVVCGPGSPAPLRNIAGGLQQRGSEVDVAVED